DSCQQERTTASRSACLARLGKRAEISSPDRPCLRKANGEAISLPSVAFMNWSGSPWALKLGGRGWPLSLVSAGLGSKVSRWLGPPVMNRKITLLALAGKCGFRGASGLDAPAA